MTKDDLTIEQMNAIDTLLTGATDQEAADVAGVARQTVWEWRNRNAPFMAELAQRRESIWAGQAERLRALVPKALDVIEEDLEGTWDHRRRAAYTILRIFSKGVELQPAGPADLESIESDLRGIKLSNLWP